MSGLVYDAMQAHEEESREIAYLLFDSSVKWVETLSRETIGSFACEPKVLAWADASLEAKEMHGTTVLNYLNPLWQRITKLDAIFMKPKAQAEAALWASETNDHSRNVRVANSEVIRGSSWFMMLQTITNRPELLPYFERGLHDVDYMDRCITGNIDPELAWAIHQKSKQR